MRASVSFEVKRVVESLAARRAKIAFDVTVALDVTVEQTLQRERLVADAAAELVLTGLHAYRRAPSNKSRIIYCNVCTHRLHQIDCF